MFHFLADQERINSRQGRHQPFKALTIVFTVGETGVGKSTLLDTLFNTRFGSSPGTHDNKSVHLKANTYGDSILSSTSFKSQQFCHFEPIESQIC